MKKMLESYIGNSPKKVSVELTVEEYGNLVVDTVNFLVDVNLDGCVSSGIINEDLNRIGTYVERILLDFEEEDSIEVLYNNPFDYYVEPSELFTINIIKYLFDVEAGEVMLEAFDWCGDYRYFLVIEEKLYEYLKL